MVPHPCVAIPPPGHPEDETTLKEAWNWRCDRHHRNALFNLPSASIGRRWALPEEIILTPRAGRLYPAGHFRHQLVPLLLGHHPRQCQHT